MLFETVLFFALATGPPPETKAPKIPQYRRTYLEKELAKREFSPEEIKALLEDPRTKAYKSPPKKSADWQRFSREVLSPASVRRGNDFLEKHRQGLEEAERELGVSKEDIVAIYRVETDLGENTGSYAVLGVFYHKLAGNRWKEATRQLIAFSEYCRNLQLDCPSIKGSYAGAFGISQFMPLSLKFALDGDGDGKIDLFNVRDANRSTANFLTEHGYKRNKRKALAAYYGSSRHYPDLALKYAAALRKK